MDFTMTAAELRFRDELRGWLAVNPPGVAPMGDEASFDFRRAWQRRMYESGWVGIHWPREYGGRGANPVELAIFNEELGRSGAPRFANTIAIEMGGPTIITHGTPAQKERLLEPILSAEEIWCQAFSEPGAGSDLASLRTRADRVPGGFRVTGQKVWTSLARQASWCMMLARTDPDSQGHRGLTYFLMDMQQDEIEPRPIVQATGESEFNELFLDGAYVSDDQVVGEVGKGWRVAITTLMNERAGLALAAQVDVRRALDEAKRQVVLSGRMDDPLVLDRLADLHVRAEGLRLQTYRGLSDIERTGAPGPSGSLAKLQWAAVNQAVAEFTIDLLGPAAVGADSPEMYRYLRSRANSIEGGTTEVLKDIVAERVLSLPRSR
ncbi:MULTISPECIES: acyl-CoA dehydrogenase family protein [unclassified Nocardioides]|uniref:acyl-CoA dehydrogenase family protein n=1 Tax=unclassified Nocardioides TaxID=2615069 RepID=UPI0000571AC0|nr:MULTISPECIES: acyl-CoA dehydrogenase family protein [unclassified Nocardioides]ABL80328.1 acyl-CoA dehydrogenase domain protein [Nocardioides sp. JS614]